MYSAYTIIIIGILCAIIGAVGGWSARDFKAKIDKIQGK
jgi:hypothetical protein